MKEPHAYGSPRAFSACDESKNRHCEEATGRRGNPCFTRRGAMDRHGAYAPRDDELKRFRKFPVIASVQRTRGNPYLNHHDDVLSEHSDKQKRGHCCPRSEMFVRIDRLRMQSALLNREGRFSHRLAHRRMGVTGACQIFRRTAKLHQHGDFVNHIACAKTDNVSA